MAVSEPMSLTAVMVYGPLSILLTSRIVSTAWRSLTSTWKWPPDSIVSPSRDHVILGLGWPVKGILMSTFSPLSKKAVSRKRGGTLILGALLMTRSARVDLTPALLTARHTYSSSSSPYTSLMMSDRVTLWAVISSYSSGPSGGPGRSAGNKEHSQNHHLELRLGQPPPHPYSPSTTTWKEPSSMPELFLSSRWYKPLSLRLAFTVLTMISPGEVVHWIVALTDFVLGHDGLGGLERLGLANDVDGAHPEQWRIGEPPSSLGCFHDRRQLSLVTLLTSSGGRGGPGLSEKRKEVKRPLHKSTTTTFSDFSHCNRIATKNSPSTVTYADAEHSPNSFLRVSLYRPVSLRAANGISNVVCVLVVIMSARVPTGLSSTVQVALGRGDASTGTSKLMRSPAFTTRSWRKARSMVGAMNLGLAITDLDASLGSPGPPLLTAMTRNSYSSPSIRLVGLVEGVLGLDSLLRSEGLGPAQLVLGADPELVLVSRDEAVDLELSVRPNGLSGGHPPAGGLVHLLHDVLFNGVAAVISGCVPLERDAVGPHVRDLERALGRARLVQDDDVDLGDVLAVYVLGRDDEGARVGASGTAHAQLGVVVRMPLSLRSGLSYTSLLLFGTLTILRTAFSLTRLVPKFHSTSGAGSPVILTSNTKGSPSRTVMSRRFLRSILGGTLRGLHVMDLEASLASPGPAALMARTLNS
ncbi:hypothetical protein FOCC_FOCC013174 [Frankliniella occidentalis]|nr:hypothetical protein FOCC_FOCC013174 [Frankliniella occidentalis]